MLRANDEIALSLLALAAASAVVFAPGIAAAEWPFDNYRPRSSYSEQSRPKPRRDSETAHRPSSSRDDQDTGKDVKVSEARLASAHFPLIAVVSLASQRIKIYDDAGLVLQSRVSSGQPGHHTPLGIFKVIEKQRYHESNIYSGAPMPFMQRITWSGIALHAGYVPSYPASHGCIRLPEQTARDLFQTTRVGMTVIVAPRDIEPEPFAHQALPTPTMTPADAGTVAMLPPALAGAPVQTASIVTGTLASDSPQPAIPLSSLNPQQRGAVERIQSKAAVTTAAELARTRLAESRATSEKANKASDDVRVAEAALANASEKLAVAQRANSPQMADLEAAKAAATADLSAARAGSEALSAAAFAAADDWRSADAAAERAIQAAKLAEKADQPLSVFISRKEGRLFVRQGFAPIYDAAVTIEGNAPLGTHMFTAIAADGQTGQLTWSALTIPKSEPAAAPKGKRTETATPPAAPSTAAEALARVTIAADVRQKLNDRVWLGASVILSDHGLGEETGVGTDFVVLTR